MDEIPTRKADLLHGVTEAAKAANKADRLRLDEMKATYRKWLDAGDISSLELDKLRRRIGMLERSLPKEKQPGGKQRRSKKKRRARQGKGAM